MNNWVPRYSFGGTCRGGGMTLGGRLSRTALVMRPPTRAGSKVDLSQFDGSGGMASMQVNWAAAPLQEALDGGAQRGLTAVW